MTCDCGCGMKAPKAPRPFDIGQTVWVDCLNGLAVAGTYVGGGSKIAIVKCAPFGIEYRVAVERVEAA